MNGFLRRVIGPVVVAGLAVAACQPRQDVKFEHEYDIGSSCGEITLKSCTKLRISAAPDGE